MIIQTLFIKARGEHALTVAEVESAIRGQLKVIRVAGEYGFSRTELLPLRLNAKEQAAFSTGKDRGFLMLTRREKRLFDVWRRYCQAARQPLVYALYEDGRPLATVGLDMATTRGKLLTDEGIKKISSMFRARRGLKERHSRFFLPDLGPVACEDRYVPVEQAADLARSLLGVATSQGVWLGPPE
ncbi:MAG: hypothetical protein P4N41_23355 [Negativicutes bacterium]|nr:hypothetical protein [Negativicutes bacterium]